jgi:C4-dicarboxylate transporter DctM subunit
MVVYTVPPAVILFAIILFYFFLGMFYDAISMLVMTLPTFFPAIVALGYDPIWFGVICVLMCEVGLLTPPVGVNCYVVAATVPDTPLEEVFRGIWPFVLMNMIALVILVIFPQIALFLPSRMRF